TRGDAELAQQVLHVCTDRVLRDEQAPRDLVGPKVVVEQEQHLELARRQGRGDLLRNTGATSTLADTVEQTSGDRARQRRLAVCDASQKLDDSRRRLALQKVTRRAAANCAEQV